MSSGHHAVLQTGPRRVRIFLAAAAFVGLALTACSGAGGPDAGTVATPQPAAESDEPEPPVDRAELVTDGAALYAANCQQCHGDRAGKGGTGAPRHDGAGHTWHHPDAQLKDWVLNGKFGFAQMPALGDKLTESHVGAILALIKTWWTDEQRATQADVSRRFQEALDKQNRTR